MPIIKVETFVKAPINNCFDLARDIDIHTKTVWKHTREIAVTGVTKGRIDLGDTVTFEATHFFVRQRLTSKIVEFERPIKFTDEMQTGAFKYLRHQHEFIEVEGGTILRDILDFASPFGFLGRIIDLLILERYMRRFITYRNQQLKRLLESDVEAKGIKGKQTGKPSHEK